MSDFSFDERLSQKHTKTLEDLIKKIQSYYPSADVDFITRAYQFSEKAHEGQIRRSGEAYISHPLSVAGILADLRLDMETIATGLLHDTVEDTAATLEDIKSNFGEAVSHLVDGVTKISKMNFKNTHEKQGENIRKMIVAMGKDVRVVLVKLADRLHNMRTLNHMAYLKQAVIAQETLEIYCPLASRLGISSVKIELEDLSFRYLHPEQYYQLSQKVARTEKDRNHYIEEVKRLITSEIGKAGFRFEVQGRSKHLWSIYRKMQNRKIDYEQVNDILAFRVIVETVPQCYEVLGHTHALWKPIPGRFKDFIAMPKANNYQSLHTTVIGPGGERIETQIRTREMHLIAERGIAAHWKYKEGGRVDDQTSRQFDWLKDLVNMQQQVGNADELLENVKSDLFETDIYVFTPKGDVRELPEGATPIDFAYAVHTDVGNRCVGARVNGRIVQLKYVLQNGDTVEVMTAKTQVPSKDWLKMCVTNRAKSKIRQFVKEEQRRRSLILGKELVEKEFRKFGMSASKHLKGDVFEEYMREHGVHDVEEMYIKVGYGRLEPKHLVDRLAPQGEPEEKPTEETNFMQRVVKSATQKMRKNGNSLVVVDGMGDVLVHFGKCCHPIPGDPITGFITRGRGITVHRADCQKAFEMDQMRKVDVSWGMKAATDGMERTARVRIISHDVPGLLKLMSETFSAQEINIQNAQIRTTKDKKAVCIFDISVKDASQLSSVILALEKIQGVIGVSRLTRG